MTTSDPAVLLRRIGPPRRPFLASVAHWFAYRMRLRAPQRMARIEREVPMRTVPRSRPAAAPSAAVIPRVVHQTWIDDRFGRHHAAALGALRDLNPDFAFRLVTDPDIDAYMRAEWGGHPISEVYFRARYGPMKTDIWRYCTLFTDGGVYLDIGKGLAAPLARFVDAGVGGVVSYEGRSAEPVADAAGAARMLRPDGVVMNWLLAFRPHHPVLGHVIDGIVHDASRFDGATSKDPKHDILRLTGPLQLTAAFATALGRGEADDVRQVPAEFDGAAVWEVRGAWVRHATRAPYILARDASILAEPPVSGLPAPQP